MFFLGPVFVLLQEFILLSKLEDESIEFLIVNFNPFKIEDLAFERVDEDIFVITLNLSDLIGSDSGFCVV